MARIEKNASVEKQLQEVRGDVLKEVKMRNRSHRPWITCSIISLFLIASFFIWVGWIIAATGLVEVPVFTRFAYQTPVPAHEVQAGTSVETLIQETFSTLLTERLYEGGGTIEDTVIDLSIPEESLTTSIRNLLEETDVPFVDPGGVQVAVGPEFGIEVFAPVMDSDLGTAMIVQFDLMAVDGNIVISPKTVDLGSLSIPAFILTGLFELLIKKELIGLNDRLSGYASVDSITTEQGELILSGEISVEIQDAQ
jgi:hypothetical protein